MMILVLLLVALIVLVSWVIFMPVNIVINTTLGLYQLSQAGTVVVSFHPNKGQPVVARIFGVKIDLRKGKPAAHEKAVRKVRKKNSKPPEAWLLLFRGIMKSFCCKRFVCSLDLDDVVLNAQLFPVLHLLSHGPVRLSTNFRKECFLDAYIQARINRMLWPLLRFFLTTK